MTCRIGITDRRVFAIRIQVEAQNIIPLSHIRVFLNESRGNGIVHAGVQIVESGLRVVLVSGIENVARCRSRLVEDISKRIVVVGRGDRSVRGKECRYIGVAVVEIEECVFSEGAGDEVQAIDIPSRLVAQSVQFQNDFVILVKEPCRTAVYGFDDTKTVAVVGVLDGCAIGRDGADELVQQIVGVVLLEHGFSGDSVGVCERCDGQEIAVVVVGVIDGSRERTVQVLSRMGKAVKRVVRVNGSGYVAALGLGLGRTVAGGIVGIGGDFSRRLGDGQEAVLGVVGITRYALGIRF